MKTIKRQLILFNVLFFMAFICCGAVSAAQYADLQVSNSNCLVSGDGETADFSLTVTNNGPSAAQNVVLQDQMLGVDVKSSQYSINNGAWQDWNQHYITLGTLNAGTSVLIQFQADVTGTSLTNRAQVSSTTNDLIRNNNVQIYKTQASYTITATAGTGGIINPNGNVNVYTGNSQSFTITPDTGYTIADVTVDGSSQGPINTYTFNNVQANHTINATFNTTTQYRVYVANYGSDSVSVINNTNNTVIATIPVGDGPFGVAVSPDGTRAYVANYFSGTVSVIDTTTNTVIATITVGFNPRGVAVSPDGTKAYVANYGSGTVSVIDTTTNTVTTTIPTGYPYGVAVSPDGTRAYVTNSAYNGFVSVIDTTSNTVTTTIPVGDYPFGVAVSPDGTRAYVTRDGINWVGVIDTTTDSIITNIRIESYSLGVAVSPDGSRAYVTDCNGSFVSVIDTTTNTVTTTIPVGIDPVGVAVSPYIGPV
ncbi:MAG: DUF11 domain-containing protein [Methanobacterium sp.]|nr:DUF11 domain-containing protein [Methanobacterium sp.]